MKAELGDLREELVDVGVILLLHKRTMLLFIEREDLEGAPNLLLDCVLTERPHQDNTIWSQIVPVDTYGFIILEEGIRLMVMPISEEERPLLPSNLKGRFGLASKMAFRASSTISVLPTASKRVISCRFVTRKCELSGYHLLS